MLIPIVVSAILASTASLVAARVDPPGDGNIGACHEEQCDNCPITANVNEGYPNCIIYPSSGNLAGYEASSGNGYDVWWNSGDPNPGCKIIVRTPASTDLPACGYFLRSWDVGGCYYTAIQESFMLQYCCGTGDCDAAAPSKRSIDEVHAAHLTGVTSSTAFKFENLTHADEGSIDLGPAGDVKFRRRGPGAVTQKTEVVRTVEKAKKSNEYALEKTAAVNEKRCDDSFDLADTYTKGGEQVKVSTTANCNVQGGCPITIMSSVTTGYSVDFSVGVNIGVFESSLSVSFSQEESHSISTTFQQDQGTSGYVSFIPTFKCYRGTYHSCDEGDADGDACNPQFIGEGDSKTPDGTYSFVYSST